MVLAFLERSRQPPFFFVETDNIYVTIESRSSMDASLEFDDVYYAATEVAGVNDAYSRLMKKERRVLDTVDRVVARRNRDLELRRGGSSLLDESLRGLWIRTVRALEGGARDAWNGRPLDVVFSSERRMYMGVALSATCILIMIMSKADGS